MSISFQEWLDIVQEEYLKEFISRGGAAVKFLIPLNDKQYDHYGQGLRKAAEEEGFLFVGVDSATTKIHMMDKLFHEISRQVNWEEFAYTVLAEMIKENGYEVPPIRNEFNLQTLAALNEVEENLLRKDINKWLTKRIYKDFNMSQEFRIAMIQLCLAELEPQTAQRGLRDPIKEWLTGELPKISTLKAEQIFQKVGRHNARHMFLSLTHWLKVAGINGLVLCLDISRYTVASKPKFPDDSFYYTVPALLDAYEVLRQFIDVTDNLENCFIVVIASPSFTTDDKRGVARYPALKMRIWDEVRDRVRDNPLAPLISVLNCT